MKSSFASIGQKNEEERFLFSEKDATHHNLKGVSIESFKSYIKHHHLIELLTEKQQQQISSAVSSTK